MIIIYDYTLTMIDSLLQVRSLRRSATSSPPLPMPSHVLLYVTHIPLYAKIEYVNRRTSREFNHLLESLLRI